MKSVVVYAAASALSLLLVFVFSANFFRFAHIGADNEQLAGILVGGFVCSLLSVWSLRRLFRRYGVYKISRALKKR